MQEESFLYYNSIYDYLLKNYAFENYIISSNSISFTVNLNYIDIILSCKITNHEIYNVPTIFFQIYTIDEIDEQSNEQINHNIEIQSLNFTKDALEKLISNRHTLKLKNNNNNNNSPILSNNSSSIAIDSSGKYYIHPCQLHLFNYKQDHSWISLFLSSIGFY
jgi:hypothetical protein